MPHVSDPHHDERARLAGHPAIDPRARALILDSGVRIADARELAASARRIAAGGRKQGFGSQALNPDDKAQALSLAMGSSHIENGGVTFDGVRQVLGAPVVVRN